MPITRRISPAPLPSTPCGASTHVVFAFSELRSEIDDEYARAGIADPKVLLTTCRDPSSKLSQFAKVSTPLCHTRSTAPTLHSSHLHPATLSLLYSSLNFVPQELRLVFPGAERINRGAAVVSELVAMCRAQQFTDLIIVHEHRGQPGKQNAFLLMVFSSLPCVLRVGTVTICKPLLWSVIGAQRCLWHLHSLRATSYFLILVLWCSSSSCGDCPFLELMYGI